MSDHSSSTGSSGSSTNSWTLLTPEEAAAENPGQLDDGTESLGDAPSLSEELVAAAVAEIKPSDIPLQCVLSEEGHQICQETTPESGDGPTLCCPLQPDEPEATEPESQPPVIHDIVLSSPSDNEDPSAAFVSSIDFGAPQDVTEPDESTEEAVTEPVTDKTEPVVDAPLPVEIVTASELSLREEADVTEAPAGPVPADLVPETIGLTEKEMSPVVEEEKKEEDEEEEEEKEELSVLEKQQEQEEETPASCHDEGLRRRTAPSGSKTSDEEDEDEEEAEMEFKLPEKKEYKMAWSAKKCIIGVAVLLILGALFLTGDLDPTEVPVEESQPDTLPSKTDTVLSARLSTADRKLQPMEVHERKVLEHLEKNRQEITAGVKRSKIEQSEHKKRKEDRKHRDEWETKKLERLQDRKERRKSKPWKSHQKQRANDMADFWRVQEQKLRRPMRPRHPCTTVEVCAAQEGLFPVERSEFEELLEGYLSKLEGSPRESKDYLRWLVADLFSGNVFPHNRRAFGDFVEDVADILEDMADAAEGGDEALEEAMEEFEREALWKFALTEKQ
ncbi:uncharacterized protein DDB_G0286299 [Corythoichthys intestinalis]|uniref:uncharacterized protein DDB_G0286299 n=1 Tax=Corythoichthys intestinalis TaxID=161448 RepID=UPI0025A68861|nr:uncharacterized protein DDB_G0286299 [Corythoichthys intestinalis]XP_057684675.1 uncharacterized protein DDB_G0286299 [Corythoichthys intestinalis]XP_057684676.1 uncharacterized protein DDB_G0286299 [Corythoichthys intestinalis]XP_061808748.1 uncharacterized protein DDB_G0286299-like [Nerophis lumbriciformis]